MVKYSLSQRKIPRAEPEGLSKGSGYISPYIPPLVIIQTLSISKNDTSSIVLTGWENFPYCSHSSSQQQGHVHEMCHKKKH